MMNAKDIVKYISIQDSHGPTDFRIQNIQFDSRKVSYGSLFVAITGTQTDGHEYIEMAIDKGAVSIICEKFPRVIREGVNYTKVNDSASALGTLASGFYGNPSSQLILVGVTGTNGKTTIASLLHSLFTKMGYHCGLLSTIKNKIGNKSVKATHTTPDALQINELMLDMLNSGCSHCFMEVSSHAIDQKRISGLSFRGGVFTNLTHDHLDYHLTFDAYLKVKKAFFDHLSETSFALSNIDDRHGHVVLQNTKARKKTYALKHPADFKGKIIESQLNGLLLNFNGQEVWCKLIGNFNAYNLLAVYGSAMLLGEDETEVLTTLTQLDIIEGRFDHFQSRAGITVIIDYAHTPDALENVLKTIASIRTGNEKLISIVGAGGNRDKNKRPQMASIAGKFSNLIILSSDNPRDENPDDIIRDMETGLDEAMKKNMLRITDRKEAIKTAAMMAQQGDIILIAGKGHEKYQEIKGIKHEFDDKKIIMEFLTANNNTDKQKN